MEDSPARIREENEYGRERARRELAVLRESQAATALADDDLAARGIGTARDGLIRVVAQQRRLRSVEVDGRLLRETPEALAAGLTEAANAALEDLRSRTVSSAEPPADPSVLGGQLGDALQESAIGMHRITTSLQDAMAQIRDQSGMMHGHPKT